LEYKLLKVGIPSRNSEYLPMVKNGIRIDTFGIGIDQFDVELELELKNGIDPHVCLGT